MEQDKQVIKWWHNQCDLSLNTRQKKLWKLTPILCFRVPTSNKILLQICNARWSQITVKEGVGGKKPLVSPT